MAIRKCVPVLLALAILLIMPLMAGNWSHAQGKLILSQTELTFTGEDIAASSILTKNVSVELSSVDIEKAVSNDPTVADVEYCAARYVQITPVSAGECTITVAGTNKETANIKITVKDDWYQAYFEMYTYAIYHSYGCATVDIYGLPGAYGTLQCGPDTYEIDPLVGMYTEDDPTVHTVVWLDKIYKVGTRFTLTLGLDGVEANHSFKVLSNTDIRKVTVKKKAPKKVLVYANYLTRDDVVKVKYSGRTYKRKLQESDSSGDYVSVSVPMKQKAGKNSRMTVTIVNKFGQTLDKQSIRLSNWTWFNEEVIYD